MASLRAAGITVRVPDDQVDEVRGVIREALETGTYRWIRAADRIEGTETEPDMLLWTDLLVGPGIATMITTDRIEQVPPTGLVSFPK